MADQDKDPLLLSDAADCPSDAGHTQAGPNGVFSLPDLDFEPDPELVAQGWERRFMADPIRAREAIHLYTELGYEVCTKTIKPEELSTVCGNCRLAVCRAYVTIYTRKRL